MRFRWFDDACASERARRARDQNRYVTDTATVARRTSSPNS